VLAFKRQVQAIYPVVGNVHHIPGLSEALTQVLGKLDFVFDEQDFHGVILEECGSFADYEFVIWLLVSCRGSLSKVHPVSQGIAQASRQGLT
jgi:hypothetical protein